MSFLWLLYTEILVRPITNILVALYQLFSFLHIPYPLGFAIIGLTIVIRLIIYPLMHAQFKTTHKMQQLTPHLNRVKEKHKGDAMRIQQETMKLYKEHGVNPAAGCLTALVQLPIIMALYSVLAHIVGLNAKDMVAQINAMLYQFDFLKLTRPWDPNFFGIPLSKNPSDLVSSMPLILLLPLITAVLQYVQTKMMIPTKKPGDKAEKKADDFATAFQTQSLYIFPVMIAYLSYTFPVGLSLYWNTFTLFGILQQYHAQLGQVIAPVVEIVKDEHKKTKNRTK